MTAEPFLRAYVETPDPEGYTPVVYGVLHQGRVRYMPGYRYQDNPNLEVVDTATIIPSFALASQLARDMTPC